MTDVDPLAPAFAELHSLLVKEQYKSVIKKADDVLRSAKGDVDALRCKAFACLMRSKFNEAVAVAAGMADEELKFYAAYAHYRLNHLSDALKQLPIRKADASVAVMELKGQILYKQGNYNQAKLTFAQCLSYTNADSLDMKTNLLAALAASGTSQQMDAICEKFSISQDDGFEVAFNQACNHIALGNQKTAMDLLELTRRLGLETLFNEGLTEAEIDIELMPVTVQMCYVRSLEGLARDTVQELSEAFSKISVGTSMKCVIENNLLAAQSLQFSDHPPKRLLYESAKKLERMLVNNPVQLLSPAQAVTVACNRTLLLISLNHMTDARPILEELLDEHPEHESVKMTQAVMLAKEGKLSAAAQIMQDIIHSHEELFLSAMLFRGQLLCLGGSSKEALKMLVNIDDQEIKYMGSMVATKIALMEQAADYDGCCQLLDEAMEWWRQQGTTHHGVETVALSWCLDKYSIIKLKQGDISNAITYCNQALEMEQDEIRRQMLISRLARMIGTYQIDCQLEFSAWLPEGPILVDADIDDLEGNINGMKRGETFSKKRQQVAENGQVAKRKRKPRYPKGFDPETPGPTPDPERWLPKWQRSGNKRRQHGRRKDAVKGSQGAGKVDESLDRALHKSEPSSSRGGPRSSDRPGPRRKHRR